MGVCEGWVVCRQGAGAWWSPSSGGFVVSQLEQKQLEERRPKQTARATQLKHKNAVWGPLAGIRSSEWIGHCAEQVLAMHRPNLTLVYLPHLDYDLQRYGPVFPGLDENLREVDRVAGGIIDLARQNDMEVIVLSEYGITPVTDSISINLALRETGLLKVHRAQNGELLDAGASEAFALSDHQVAHVYVRAEENRSSVKRLLEELPGVGEVLDGDGCLLYTSPSPRDRG